MWRGFPLDQFMHQCYGNSMDIGEWISSLYINPNVGAPRRLELFVICMSFVWDGSNLKFKTVQLEIQKNRLH